MYRQGDVLLIPVDQSRLDAVTSPLSTWPQKQTEIPSKDGRLILAEGEATGHHHSVDARHGKLYATAMGTILMLARAAELLHQEHEEIRLPEGAYEVILQREYSPGEARRVRD